MKCEFEGSAAQLDAAQRVVILRFPLFLAVEHGGGVSAVSLLCVPSPSVGKTTQACSELGMCHHPLWGFPAPTWWLCWSRQLYWCFWNNLCVPFFSDLLPCFSLEEPKLGALRLASALKWLSDHRRDAASDLWALWSSLCPAPTSTFVFKATWSWRHFCLPLCS